MNRSATAAAKIRTQTPSFVNRWPDIPNTIMQDAQQKVAPRGVTIILAPHLSSFKLKRTLCVRLYMSLTEPLSCAPTAELGWPEIMFDAPLGSLRSAYCLL